MTTSRKQGHFPIRPPGFQPLHDKEITRERLAAQMAAFDKAGGKIEVLGITPLRRKPAKDEGQGKSASPRTSSNGERQSR